MAAPIDLRDDFDSASLRRLAKTTRNATQSRRLLALAEIYAGGSRTDAARIRHPPNCLPTEPAAGHSVGLNFFDKLQQFIPSVPFSLSTPPDANLPKICTHFFHELAL
jgi:hypothetical protein